MSRLHCGASRPGHFDGVLTVLNKLQNLLRATEAWFGEKDYQQLQIVRKWVEDLYVPLKIHAHPIVRSRDGLALSSRNRYLSDAQRALALKIPEALDQARKMVEKGETCPQKLAAELEKGLSGLKIDYLSFVDAKTLQKVEKVGRGSLFLLAVFCGESRLIDNRIL
jgi:pantoate--beta-alanine ligase